MYFGLSKTNRGVNMEIAKEKYKNTNYRKPIPFFELGVFLFMGYAGITFFIMDSTNLGDQTLIKGLFVELLPLYIWGVIQLITCILMGMGLIFNKEWPRMIGLGLAFLIFLIYAISYITEARLVGGVYGINSLVCLLSVFYVHQSEL